MSKYLVQASWSDVPHLTEEAKEELMAAYPPYQRDARTRGVPQLGSGAIYQVPESDIIVPDFEVPQYYLRAYGMDVGWNRTAAVWGAKDPSSNTIYLYSEHYRGQAEPIVHAMAVQSRGKWIPGVIDPAAAGRSQKDGIQLLIQYREMGLDLEPAINAVESGIYAVWQLLSAGKLKVFRSLASWLGEFRLYQRDTDGRIVKQNDHLMDACLDGNTLIFNNIPIKDLVGVEGWVLSRSGSWARFHGARKTIENAPVVRVEFEDGSEVIATYDHRFLTPEGWVEARDMEGRSCYNGEVQCNQSQQMIRWWCLEPVRYLKDAVTTFVASISSLGAMAFVCTGGYGRFGTKGQYLRDMLSTTGTGIERTTNMRTWNSCFGESTPVITKRGTGEEYLRQRLWGQQGGMEAKRERSGTRNTSSESKSDFIKPTNGLARFAARFLLRERLGSSAPITARRSFVTRLAWTTRNVVAWFVAEGLWRIATLGRSAARESAVVSCVGVSEAGTGDVYCLTVPGTSAFCLANGVVVHNTRYLISSGVDRMKAAPLVAKRPSQLVYGLGAAQAWME